MAILKAQVTEELEAKEKKISELEGTSSENSGKKE